MPERTPYYWEARRLADRYNIPEHDREDFVQRTAIALAFKAFRIAIEPMQKTAASLFALAPLRTVVSTDGTLDIQPPVLTDDQKTAVALIDEMIAQCARQHGIAWPARERPQ